MNLKRILISKPVLLVEVIILAYFAFNVGQAMYKRHDIEADINRLEAEISKLEKDKGDLSSLLSYVQTDAFVEQEAREKLNLAKHGESLLLVPESDSVGTNAPAGSIAVPDEYSQSQAVPARKTNLAKWWQYFFEHERLALE